VSGKIKHIYITSAAGEAMRALTQVSVMPGKGIQGDRYASGQGTFSEQLKGNPAAELSLIESEVIDAFNQEHKQAVSYHDFRRNIVTTGIRLNALVGKTFYIGPIQLRGLRLCEPCAHLATTVNALVLPHLVGRGGLRAQILSPGEMTLGDTFNTSGSA